MLLLSWLFSASVSLADPFGLDGLPTGTTEPEPAGPDRSLQLDFVVECHDVAVAKSSSPDAIKIEVFDSAGLVTSKRVRLDQLLPNPLDPATCPAAHLDGVEDHWWQVPMLQTFVTSWTGLRVRLTATGANAAWIDRVLMSYPKSSRANVFGVDGKQGWCLSTDSGDSFGGDRQDGNCKKCVEFRADGTTGGC